jgi:hypothetical protein
MAVKASPDAEPDIGDPRFDQAKTELDDELRACVKSELEPGERLIWAARACPPPVPVIAPFPAFFTALVCGLSGFALAVVHGVYGLVELPPWEAAVVFSFAPAVIGFFIVMSLVGRRIVYLRARWRLAHTFYCLTDGRAIVGLDHGDGEPIWFSSLPFSQFHDTLCIDHADGSGDVYFIGDWYVTDPDGHREIRTGVVAPECGFVGVARATEVAEIVRRVLRDRRRIDGWPTGRDAESEYGIFWVGE